METIYSIQFHLPSLHSLEWPGPGLWLMVIHKDQAIEMGSNLDGSIFSCMHYGTKKIISFIFFFLTSQLIYKESTRKVLRNFGEILVFVTFQFW